MPSLRYPIRLCGAFVALRFDATSFHEKALKMGHHVGQQWYTPRCVPYPTVESIPGRPAGRICSLIYHIHNYPEQVKTNPRLNLMNFINLWAIRRPTERFLRDHRYSAGWRSGRDACRFRAILLWVPLV